MLRTSIALLLVFGLSACGGNDDSQSSESSQPEILPAKYDNITIDIEPNNPLIGDITVYLGKWYPCSDEHPEYCNSDGKNKVTRDDIKYITRFSADELRQFSPESISKDLFADGQYTLLDVLLYISHVRDDFELTLGDFDESIGTYKFTVNFDYNQDGEFSLEGDGADNFNNTDWYTRFTYTAAEFWREVGEPSLEAIYERTDQFLIRNNTEVRIEHFDPLMTERREEIQHKEVERLNAHGGKIVVPEIQVDYGDGRGYVTVAQDVEAKPYNLRPDLIKKDVITMMDVLMTVDQEMGFDIGYSFWPTLSTEANVNAYAITRVNGKGHEGMAGWLLYTGELESDTDFFSSFPFHKSVEDILNAPTGTYCSWMGELDAHTAKVCKEEWNYTFGGNQLHQMTDSWLQTYPHEVIRIKWIDMGPMAEITEINNPDDGKFSVYDITKADAKLTESHFGWKVADCGLCHSIDNIHLNGDSPELPDSVEPYFCASCHGGNGAPEGHGEQSRCHWCHSQDKAMDHHGEASMESLATDIQCSDSMLNQSGPCANLIRGFPSPIHDKAGNLTQYDGTLKSRGNSDWFTSQSFPDPYSCVTCHPNPK